MHVVLLTQEPAFWCRTNCWIKLFLFSLCTKLLLIAPYNYRWTTCHMDFFFLICFCLLFRLGQCSEWQEAMCGGSGKVHEPGFKLGTPAAQRQHHMDYFNDVLIPFWVLNVVVALLSMQGQKALGFHQKYLHLFSEDEWGFYGFGKTWRGNIYDRIFLGGEQSL